MILIELYRKGKITEAFRAFKKIYFEVVDQIIDHLEGQQSSDSAALRHEARRKD
jgi:hypothetical protein